MKRQKFPNCLVLVRTAVGLALDTKISGNTFAKSLGIPAFKLRSIESGRERISEKLAETVMLLTGAAANSLQTNRPRDLLGNEYRKESYLDFLSMRLSKDGMNHIAAEIQKRFDTLLSAANGTGTIFFLLYSIEEWLKRIVENRRLKARIETMIGTNDVQLWARGVSEGIKPALVENAKWPAIEMLLRRAQLIRQGFLSLDEPDLEDSVLVTPKVIQKALADAGSAGDLDSIKSMFQRLLNQSSESPGGSKARTQSNSRTRKTKKVKGN